jgi:hypothetical protein
MTGEGSSALYHGPPQPVIPSLLRFDPIGRMTTIIY